MPEHQPLFPRIRLLRRQPGIVPRPQLSVCRTASIPTNRTFQATHFRQQYTIRYTPPENCAAQTRESVLSYSQSTRHICHKFQQAEPSSQSRQAQSAHCTNGLQRRCRPCRKRCRRIQWSEPRTTVTSSNENAAGSQRVFPQIDRLKSGSLGFSVPQFSNLHPSKATEPRQFGRFATTTACPRVSLNVQLRSVTYPVSTGLSLSLSPIKTNRIT